MKRIVVMAAAFLMVLLAACHKIATRKDELLTGSWQLIETLNDAADGSGKWTPVADSSVIQFNADNTMSGTLFSHFKKYTIINEATIEFTTFDNYIQTYHYILYKSSLIMNPPCTEACGLRFIKVE